MTFLPQAQRSSNGGIRLQAQSLLLHAICCKNEYTFNLSFLTKEFKFIYFLDEDEDVCEYFKTYELAEI